MKILLDRYFGNDRCTKSTLTVVDGKGKELMRCEAREPRYADYAESFAGCSKYCLATGEFAAKPLSAEQSPMTLTVIKSPGHRCVRFGHDECKQMKANAILVGEPYGEEPQARKIHRQQETFDRLTQFVYRAYIAEESIMVETTNCNVVR